jgi:hypothetical protein
MPHLCLTNGGHLEIEIRRIENLFAIGCELLVQHRNTTSPSTKDKYLTYF